MISLKTRTEYSFGLVFGSIKQTLAALCEFDTPSHAAITDRNSTWGHPEWHKECSALGIQPILGAEISIVEKLEHEGKKERVPSNPMSFLARNEEGLKELYGLLSEATSEGHYYFHPRLPYSRLHSLTTNIILLTGPCPRWDLLPRTARPTILQELSPHSQPTSVAPPKYTNRVATMDNYYPFGKDRYIYEVLAGRNRDARVTPMHVLNEWEWRNCYRHLSKKEQDSILNQTRLIAGTCNVNLPKAEMVKTGKTPATLKAMCVQGAKKRGLDLRVPIYRDRLKRELDLIREKNFEDYFFVLADIIQWAKTQMLVGPARGSSCGSLVCYLIGITDIDPIPFGLVFERFIDINRKDLPDIDVDFQDDRRDLVFEYIETKYGKENVARLGTVMRYKPKSAIDAVAAALKIPFGDVELLKGAILDRSTGDARAGFCIQDTFTDLEIGRKMLLRYPHLKVAGDIENHARTTGQHAAGIVITQKPIQNYCSFSYKNDAIQVDKHDAETLNLLKIDVLGLRTLSVIQDCLDQVGMSRDQLLAVPLDDDKAFKVLNDKRYAGIFQFEGFAVQALAEMIQVGEFEDIASLGALARPGPLNSGGAKSFVERHRGDKPVEYLHPLCEPFTKMTRGIVVYQEQVMQITRIVGGLNWEDVSSLRKAMSKSMGKEFFDKYWDKFKDGAAKQGLTEAEALHIWDHVNTMGSWSFNRSHAIAYGMVTYWCAWLKAYYPLEWATACLRNANNEDQVKRLLRELDREGYQYIDFDPKLSQLNWSISEGKIIGGYLNLKGVGLTKAKEFLARRKSGKALTEAMQRLLDRAITPYSYEKIFTARIKFKDLFENPAAYNVQSKIWYLKDIPVEAEGDFVVLVKVVDKDLRDHNEPFFLQYRQGKRYTGQTQFLNVQLEDDTGVCPATVSSRDYMTVGRMILDNVLDEQWILAKCNKRLGYKKLKIVRAWHENQLKKRN